MYVQVNELIRKTPDVSKIELKKLANRHNCLHNWKTVDVDVKTLADIIAQGYTIRPGIKVDGNGREHVQTLSWMFLDFDGASVKETLSVIWSSSACLWYYTPSYQPGVNEKHRLAFKLSRGVTADEYEHIYRALRKFYTQSDDTSSAGYLFFGAYSPDSVTILSENALDVEPFLSMDVSEAGADTVFSQKTGTDTKDISQSDLPNDGVRAQVLKWLAKEVWLGVCQNDINKLYCLHHHNFQDQGKDRTNIAKWGGHRPEDKTKDTGTGFFVFWKNVEQLPIFHNQGTEAKLQKGTFVDYWHHYKNELYGKGWDSITWEDDRQYKTYRKVCDDIANHFQVPYFDFDKCLKEIQKRKKTKRINTLSEIVSKYCYIMKDGGSDNFLIYDVVDHHWRVVPKHRQIWNHCVRPAMIEAGVDVLEITVKEARACISELEINTSYISCTKENFDEARNVDIIPLKNGEFNIITKKFVNEFDYSIHNMYRYHFLYHQDNQKSDKLELFFEWMRWTYKDPELYQMMIDWLALNVMGMANATEVMVCLWGSPGTGKSVYKSLIDNLLADLGATIDAKKLRNGEDRFIFDGLDGKYALTIDEFVTNQEGWNSLKLLTGSTQPKYDIEKKGMQKYRTTWRGAITTCSQDKFVLPNSDDGGIRRRVVPIQHSSELKIEKYQIIDSLMKKPEYYLPIFFWLIENIDPLEAIERVKKFANSKETKDKFREILIEQDDVLGFMIDVCEFTNNPDDVVSNIQLQASFEQYLQCERLHHVTERDKSRINKISQYIREKARIKENNFNWSLCPEPGRETKISVNKKQVKGLRGIRLKAIEAGVEI